MTNDSTIKIGDSFFEEAIYNSYVENGKYYLIKCENWLGKDYIVRDTESVFEIRVGDAILGMQDEHSGTTYSVEKLTGNTMQFGYESSFNHNSFGVNKVTTRKGHFIIHCSQKKEGVRLVVEGLEVSAASAQKHISEGKFYFLQKFGNRMGELGDGVSPNNKECAKVVFNQLGYYEYILDQCVPSEFYRKQIQEYNEVVMNYLKVKKGIDLKNGNYNYTEFLNKCIMEKYNSKKGK